MFVIFYVYRYAMGFRILKGLMGKASWNFWEGSYRCYRGFEASWRLSELWYCISQLINLGCGSCHILIIYIYTGYNAILELSVGAFSSV